MLKLNKDLFIEEQKIESIILYNANSRPMKKMIDLAKRENKFTDAKLSHTGRCIIIMEDGEIFLGYLIPPTYFQRMQEKNKEKNFLITDPKRLYIRRNGISCVTAKPNQAQRRTIKSAKEEGRFINLSGKKKTTDYIFMNNGRVYGIHTAYDFNEPKKPADDSAARQSEEA